jgi:large subunit ribosomal protein L35
MKTDKGAAKRVKITGTGRLRRLQQNRQHGFEKMTSVHTRRLSGEVDFAPGDERRIKRMLGM